MRIILFALLIPYFVFGQFIATTGIGGTVNDTASQSADVDADTSGFNESGSVVSYVDARDSDAADNFSNANLGIGQMFVASVHSVWRSTLGFAIPSVSGITSVSLLMNGNDNDLDTNFDLYILSAEDAATELDENDFSHFDGRQTGGAHNGNILNETWNTENYTDGWMTVNFNSDGIDSVAAYTGSEFYLILISKEDYDNSAPSLSVGERFKIESYTSESECPYLHITYTGE